MAEEEKAETPQSGRTQLLMRIGGGIVLLLAGAGGGWFASGIFHPQSSTATESAATEGEGEAKAEGEAKGEAKAEGEAKKEGEGEAKKEGEGEAKKEGEGEAKKEGEGEAKKEGENKGGDVVVADANGKVITNLKTFVVNLRSSGGGRVLRMEVQVESSKEVAPSLELASPKLRDTVLTAVSDYTFAELEGTDGKTRLRDELLTRINGAIAPQTINQVYFTQFVVQ